MSNNCKLSICIPTFENLVGLKRAITSILGQSFDDYEVIISDDSHSMDIANYVRQIGCEKIRYYKNKNNGIVANWNNAFAQANGEYITLLHHDDWYSNVDSLKIIIEKLEQSESSIAFCKSKLVELSESAQIIGERDSKISNDEILKLEDDWRYLYIANVIGHPSAVFFKRRAVVDNNIKWDERLKWTVDIDYYMQVISLKNAFIFIPDQLVCIGEWKKQLTRECELDWELQFKEYFYLYKKYNLKDKEKKYTRKLLDISNANRTSRYRLIKCFGDLPMIFYWMYTCDRIKNLVRG